MPDPLFGLADQGVRCMMVTPSRSILTHKTEEPREVIKNIEKEKKKARCIKVISGNMLLAAIIAVPVSIVIGSKLLSALSLSWIVSAFLTLSGHISAEEEERLDKLLSLHESAEKAHANSNKTSTISFGPTSLN